MTLPPYSINIKKIISGFGYKNYGIIREVEQMKYEEYLESFYRITFKCRVEHRGIEREYKCYIFENRKDMERYCKENSIECREYNNKDYFLLNEEEIGSLVGQRITEVIIVSSEKRALIEEICKNAIRRGYKLKYKVV